MITKIKHMQKKTLLIILSCVTVITISSILGLIWFKNKEAVSMPRISKKVSKEVSVPQTPEEAFKDIIKKNIKQEFLPSVYEITDSPDGAPFGHDVNYYFAEWNIGEKTRFSAYVAYNKIMPKDLIGYAIIIAVKEPDLSGKELGDRFFKFLPTEKWSHQYHPPEGRAKIETSSVISTINKVYACIASFNFPEPVVFYSFPNELTRSAAIIEYGFCTSSNFNERLRKYFGNFCPAFSR